MHKRLEDYLAECKESALESVEEVFQIHRATIAKMTPIEGLMYLALTQALSNDYVDHHIYPQMAVGKFRVDFVIDVTWGEGPSWGPGSFKLVVECDGHDFHEKTKEQAKADKSRHRALQILGYDVMRFTGSEIWASPTDCADEVVSLIAKHRP